MSESTYRVQGSRVYGNGESYNVTNNITAQKLANTLNTYENTLQLHKNLDQQYDRIQKTLIQTNMSLKILENDLKTLTEAIENVSTNK